MPYVFYDTETTGTQTAFDQILQFAAIKTDDNFNELDRFNIRCSLLPHIIPSPGALRVTGVTPAMLTDPALPSHYEAMRHIHAKLLKWSPATFVGFNSLNFDETLLRQAFFQTLHPAYLTNTGGNGRSDAMRIAHAVSIYAHRVQQLSDIARPRMAPYKVSCRNGKFLVIEAWLIQELFVHPLKQCITEHHQVTLPLAQRWKIENPDSQAIE